MSAEDYMELADKYGYDGELEQALVNIQMAVALVPKNIEYKEKLERLKEFMSEKGR